MTRGGGGPQQRQQQRATPTHEAEAAAHGEHDVRVELDAQRAPVHVEAHVGAAVQRVRLRELRELERRGRREVDHLRVSSGGVVGQACAPYLPPLPPALPHSHPRVNQDGVVRPHGACSRQLRHRSLLPELVDDAHGPVACRDLRSERRFSVAQMLSQPSCSPAGGPPPTWYAPWLGPSAFSVGMARPVAPKAGHVGRKPGGMRRRTSDDATTRPAGTSTNKSKSDCRSRSTGASSSCCTLQVGSVDQALPVTD